MKTLIVKTIMPTIASLLMGLSVLALPAGCPTALRTSGLGDGRTYSCFLTKEEEDYCYYNCYAV